MNKRNFGSSLLSGLLLALVLIAGAYFRMVGSDWGEQQYLHPDERFLVWVGSDIMPVDSLGEYWDASTSTLNPNNRGHGFFVYGTLPLFTARYLVEWIYGHSGFAEMLAVGRPLSAAADLLIVLLVFLIGTRLFNRAVGLLGAAFSALAVMQIQQSHFYTVDNFVNLFTWLALYFALSIAAHRPPQAEPEPEPDPAVSEFDPQPDPPAPQSWLSRLVRHPFFWLSVGFGFALGSAMASKVSAFPAAALLPAAFALYLWKLPPAERERRLGPVIVYLGIGAFVSILVFRVFQPYAFSGPGFFGLKPNPTWISNITELRNQSAGDVDFPPALQWARRSITFSGQNLTLWGLGLPLGLLAWAGVLWAGGRMLRRLGRDPGWHAPALLWAWTVLYFAWQSTAFNPTMRYQLPVYPGLALFAAWAVWALYSLGRRKVGEAVENGSLPARLFAILAGALVLALTFGWAWAFTRIYTRPVTRVEASRWIYQNVPGPINLHLQAEGGGSYHQPLSLPYDATLTAEQPLRTTFLAQASGQVQEVNLAHLVDQTLTPGLQGLTLTVLPPPQPEILPAEGQPEIPALPAGPLAQGVLGQHASLASLDGGGPGWLLSFPAPASLMRGQPYTLRLEGAAGEVVLPSSFTLQILNYAGQPVSQMVLVPAGSTLPLELPFTPIDEGTLTGVFLGRIGGAASELPAKRLVLTLTDMESGAQARAALEGALGPLPNDTRGGSYTLTLDRPFSLVEGRPYELALSLVEGQGTLALRGSANANESTWDDGLPLRLDGYDAYGGIYRGDLVFEMYWDDSPDKLVRFLNVLNEADYLFISSSRQWGSVPRVPERYPLSAEYYRRLIGCPAGRTVEDCYNVAQVGTFQGELGFELVHVVDSSPNIGPLVINDQASEEAFTVYDHPKVFIFRKTEAYDPVRVADILGAVDVSQVVHVTPRQADRHPGTRLLLPLDRLAGQIRGGTWAELFNPDSIINRSQFVAAAAWYLSLFLLGLLVYPLLRLALPGLPDRGYPLARMAGLLLFSYLAWLAGSFGVQVTRAALSLILLLLLAAGLLLAFAQRRGLGRELRTRGGYFLAVEGLFLAFFLLDLLIRLGNPDLWHPAHGGEKPMDFAYFNAVLKSSTYPPYDPWYAGGYLNYYYYGFMLVGALVKWLGITPAVAYNLVLPSVFMLIAMGAFSLAWNLTRLRRSAAAEGAPLEANGRPEGAGLGRSFIIGLAAALGMALLGNLGTVRMLFRGFQVVANPEAMTAEAAFLTRLVWAFRGFVQTLGGARLPYGLGDWYWIPSRAIPAPGDVEPITEFPFFTVLYGDPHAHLFALPVALLVLGLGLGVLLGRARWGRLSDRQAALQAGPGEPAPLEAARAGAESQPAAYSAVQPAAQFGPQTGAQSEAGAVSVYPDFSGAYAHEVSEGASPRPEAAYPAGNGAGDEPAGEAPVQARPRSRYAILGGALWFVFSGLALGSLYPTNTWDYYPYLLLVSIVLGYAVWRGGAGRGEAGQAAGFPLRTPLLALGAIALLVALTRLFWLPFYRWFGLGYSQLALWKGTHTPTGSYLVHWGLFLFVIVTWMGWETVRWMADTPASSLKRLRPYRWAIYYALAVLLVLVLLLTFGSRLPFETLQGFEVHIAWLALPLAAWAGVLLLRPDQPDAKRFVLFLVGTGLVETLFVELAVLVGDIGRMNTVFKFYLQVWTFFAVSAAAALGWLLQGMRSWSPRLQRAWSFGLAVLVFSAALYPLTAARAKIAFRMSAEAPHTLDGMAYMETSRYIEVFGEMDLGQDYRAIRWMQENVQGSPVIVEANTRDLYRWGSRFSIYTGLPGVVGWEWHQQQQRALYPAHWVTERIFEIEQFYRTTDLSAAADFLRKYDVRYIVLGQYERGLYNGPGLDKFAAANGSLWREVYREADTVIYEVVEAFSAR